MGIVTSLEPAAIANGAALSGAVHLHAHRVFAIQMPATWTAANLTFQGSYDGSTYADVYDETGNEVTVTAAASRFIILDPVKFMGLQKLKIRSGTTGSPVNQGGDRIVQLILIA